jgi:hypothetical protein
MAPSMRIILASKRIVVPDAIIIDHGNKCFWIDGRRIGIKRNANIIGGRNYFRLMSALLLRHPHHMGWYELADHIYGDDEDGGPLDLRRVIYVLMVQYKEHSAELGFKIINLPSVGLRLEPVQAIAIAA